MGNTHHGGSTPKTFRNETSNMHTGMNRNNTICWDIGCDAV